MEKIIVENISLKGTNVSLIQNVIKKDNVLRILVAFFRYEVKVEKSREESCEVKKKGKKVDR